jgi:hypothetical protein
MFADTTSFVPDGVTGVTLVRTDVGGGRGSFRNSDGNLKLSISQNETKAKRQVHQVRLDHAKTGPDALLEGVNRPYSVSIRLVMDGPFQGYTTAEKENLLEGFATWIATQANRDKLINGES